MDINSANTNQPTNSPSEIDIMLARLQQVQLPAELKEKALHQIDRINLSLKYGGNLSQLDITAKYIDWISNIPWTERTEDNLDVNAVKQSLDNSHFGLEKLKRRILEYLSIIALHKKNNPNGGYHIQSPFFVGLAGTGKTTFAKAIAEALGRKFVRIPFGGLSSAKDLRGQSKISPEAEPGMIIRVLREAKVINPVILFDEMDRVAPDARDEVMGTLLELLDPGQNAHFSDYFIDYPYNLNEVLFVCTGNNTKDVSTAVLDRLEIIEMPNYTDEEKVAIAKNYVLPKVMKDSGIQADQLTFDEDLWPKLIRPLGYEPGVRSLERVVQEIARKVAYKLVSGQGTQFFINATNINEYTPSVYVAPSQ